MMNGNLNLEHIYIERKTPQYLKANWALFIAGFVTFSTLYTFQPLFPVLVSEFGISPAAASLSLSVSTFALAWMLPVSGLFSDLFGRKKLMGFSLILTSILAIISFVSSTYSSLLAIRLIQGLILAGVPAVAMAYLNEEISPNAIGTAMGLYIAGNACGGMTGRILTSFIVDFLPWRETVVIIGLTALVMSILFWILLPPSRNFQKQPFQLSQLNVTLIKHIKEPGLMSLFILAFLMMGGFVTVYNYATFYLLAPPFNLTQSEVALIFFAYAFGAMGSSVMGSLTRRIGRPRILFTALSVMTAGVLLTLQGSLTAIVTGIVIFTIGFFGAHAVASAWVGARAKTARAQASSLYLLAYYLGSSISGTGGGYVWSSYGWRGVVGLVVLLLALAGGIVYYVSLLEIKQTDQKQGPTTETNII